LPCLLLFISFNAAKVNNIIDLAKYFLYFDRNFKEYSHPSFGLKAERRMTNWLIYKYFVADSINYYDTSTFDVVDFGLVSG